MRVETVQEKQINIPKRNLGLKEKDFANFLLQVFRQISLT